ncbi:hypothetical protein NL676_009917 [Syzygium grande]|nr:hypothetical protein NL676_009917 [Syzygium grande]
MLRSSKKRGSGCRQSRQLKSGQDRLEKRRQFGDYRASGISSVAYQTVAIQANQNPPKTDPVGYPRAEMTRKILQPRSLAVARTGLVRPLPHEVFESSESTLDAHYMNWVYARISREALLPLSESGSGSAQDQSVSSEEGPNDGHFQSYEDSTSSQSRRGRNPRQYLDMRGWLLADRALRKSPLEHHDGPKASQNENRGSHAYI